jgi:hypothetical protein
MLIILPQPGDNPMSSCQELFIIFYCSGRSQVPTSNGASVQKDGDGRKGVMPKEACTTAGETVAALFELFADCRNLDGRCPFCGMVVLYYCFSANRLLLRTAAQ